ncbi:MAG: hypothetical protein DIU69_12785 [Bacillota bacterium]|nr:MAG: hypothetical protein DIU69_12785 [Bacillota bacterium]
MSTSAWFRHAGTLILSGGVLAAVSTVLHPPTVDPLDAAQVLAEVRRTLWLWMAVHVGLAAGLWLWTLGWVALYRGLEEHGAARYALYGAISGAVALAVWLPLLTAETAGLPLLARATAAGTAPSWWRFLWPVTLGSGYVAAFLHWSAALGAALDLPRLRGPWTAWGIAGAAALVPGFPGLVAAWLYPRYGLWLLLLTLAPGALWFFALALRLRRS